MRNVKSIEWCKPVSVNLPENIKHLITLISPYGYIAGGCPMSYYKHLVFYVAPSDIDIFCLKAVMEEDIESLLLDNGFLYSGETSTSITFESDEFDVPVHLVKPRSKYVDRIPYGEPESVVAQFDICACQAYFTPDHKLRITGDCCYDLERGTITFTPVRDIALDRMLPRARKYLSKGFKLSYSAAMRIAEKMINET